MKMVNLIFVLLLSLGLNASVPKVADKVLAAFAQSYPAARQVQWSPVNNHWQAYFQENGIINKLHYNAAGELVRATRYYQASHLNPQLLVKLHRKYKEQRIFGVTEITTGDLARYFIVLEDDKSWYHVESNEYGEMQLRSHYRKA